MFVFICIFSSSLTEISIPFQMLRDRIPPLFLIKNSHFPNLWKRFSASCSWMDSIQPKKGFLCRYQAKCCDFSSCELCVWFSQSHIFKVGYLSPQDIFSKTWLQDWRTYKEQKGLQSRKRLTERKRWGYSWIYILGRTLLSEEMLFLLTSITYMSLIPSSLHCCDKKNSMIHRECVFSSLSFSCSRRDSWFLHTLIVSSSFRYSWFSSFREDCICIPCRFFWWWCKTLYITDSFSLACQFFLYLHPLLALVSSSLEETSMTRTLQCLDQCLFHRHVLLSFFPCLVCP